MATRCKILLASHSPTCTTGYGRVTRRLAHAFGNAGHTVAVAGLSYHGERHELPYRIFPLEERRPRETFAGACREFSPDVLLTIGDPWMFEYLPALPERRAAAWVAYFPVDGRPLPEEWKPWIAAVDVPVVFCRFTQDLVAAATGKPPQLIYHGVDTKRFRPMDKLKAKKLANVAGHFVVGTVARNQQRKNLPALLKAFAKFSRGKDDALLYLHTQVRAEWDLKELSRFLGIEAKTRVTADLGGGRGVPDEMLATVYNALDLFVLPTMAEGFGLPIMEAQACGVPALVTDFSACPELVPDPIQRLKVNDTLVMHRNFEQAIVDCDDISEKLGHFYRERKELEALGRRCNEFAQQFEWEIACGQFVGLVERLSVVGDQPTASSRRPERSEGPLRPRHEEILRCAQDDGLKPSVVSGQSTASGRRPERSEGSPLSLPKGSLRREARPERDYAPGAQERDRVAARGHERAGRLAEAEEACRRMLVRNPDDASAIHLLGVVRGRMGDGAEAIRLLQRAIELTPDLPAIHNDLGVVYEDRGEVAEAAECYRRAVKIRPALHQVWVNLCNALVQGGCAEESLEPCREALRLRPNYAPAHNALGAALAELGRAEEARAAFEEAIRLRPEHGEAHCNLGLTLLRLGDSERGWAEHEWRRKDRRRFGPRPGEPWDGRVDLAGKSILLFSEGGLGNTIQFVRFAPLVARMGAKVTVECQPALVEVLRTIEGIEVVTPGDADRRGKRYAFHCPLMSLPAVLGLARSCESVFVGSAPRTDLPPSQEAFRGEGPVGCARARSEESVRSADPTGLPVAAVADPGEHGQASSLAHGTHLASSGDHPVLNQRLIDEPRPSGPSGSGATGSLTLAARSDESARAAARSIGVPACVSQPKTQAGTPMLQMSSCVGAGSGIAATAAGAIPADVPYLHPEGAPVERWAKVVREAAGERTDRTLRIGVCWRGDQQRLHMRGRSFDPAQLRPIAAVPGVTLINLQHGEPAPDGVPMVTLPGLEPNKMRLLDVAAAMKSLDLVITCDTSIAHLAGALGVPVWVALKSSACWRWMLGREDSPWYPTMRLFRQERSGDWAGVFGRMGDALVAKTVARDAPQNDSARSCGFVGSALRTDLSPSERSASGRSNPVGRAASGDPARPAAHHLTMSEESVRNADPTKSAPRTDLPVIARPDSVGRAASGDPARPAAHHLTMSEESVRNADPTKSAPRTDLPVIARPDSVGRAASGDPARPAAHHLTMSEESVRSADFVGSAPRTDLPVIARPDSVGRAASGVPARPAAHHLTMSEESVRNADPTKSAPRTDLPVIARPDSVGRAASGVPARPAAHHLTMSEESVRNADFVGSAPRTDLPVIARPDSVGRAASGDPARPAAHHLTMSEESVRSADPTGSHSPLTTAFSYFDTAYVLNMDSDVERMAKASARLGRAGIAFERFPALGAPPGMRPRDPRVRAAHYACGLSHKAILLHALERGQERVLVFEDDVVLRDDVGEWMAKLVPQLQAIDWDIFYLGLHLERAGESRGPNLREVRRGFHLHAYAIARKAITRMAAHIDRVVADLAGTFDGFEDPSLVKVCAVPILAVQEPNLSYTFGAEVDRLGQYFTLFDGEDFRRHCREMAGWKARSA